MPELPETETIARDLDGAIRGRQIKKVSIRKSDVLREVSPRAFAKRLQNATILRSWRRAKLVVIDLETGDRVVVQPRFTGALLIDDGHFHGCARHDLNVRKHRLCFCQNANGMMR